MTQALIEPLDIQSGVYETKHMLPTWQAHDGFQGLPVREPQPDRYLPCPQGTDSEVCRLSYTTHLA